MRWRDHCKPVCLVRLWVLGIGAALFALPATTSAQQFEKVDCVAPVGDGDDDNDGRVNTCDNCPNTANGVAEADMEGIGNQTDTDDDGLGDACDDDDDDDGVDDVDDPCPLDDTDMCDDGGNGNDNDNSGGNDNGNGNDNGSGNDNDNGSDNGNDNGNDNDNGSDCDQVMMLFEFVSEVAIPDDDPAGIDRVGTVSDMGIIRDLNVGLEVNHTWTGDIIAELSHGGVTVLLVDQPGFPAINFGSQRDGLDVFLDDEASQSIEDIPTGDGPVVTGDWTPIEALDAFDGMEVAGEWTLTISDNQLDDTGSLIGWSLEVSTDDVDCDGGGTDNGNDNDNGSDNGNDNGSDNDNDNSGPNGIDIMVEMPITNTPLAPGDTVVVPIIGQNLGTVDAPNVSMRMQFDQFLEVLDTTGTVATQSLTSVQWAPEPIAGGNQLQQAVTFQVSDNTTLSNLTVTGIVTAPGDLVQANNTTSVTFAVDTTGDPGNGNDNTNDNDNGGNDNSGQDMPPMPPDDGGTCGLCGSGASPMGMMILLGLAFMRQRRRRI